MVVNITGTSEINPDQISLVVSILNKSKGQITYKVLNPIPAEIMRMTIKDIDTKENSWYMFNKLDEISNNFRFYKSIDPNQFVVVLSNITLNFNEYNSPKNWFSHFSESKNIFIRTYNLDALTNDKPELALAHQVIENLFQYYSGYKSGDFSYYHSIEKGCCINAFCLNEFELEFKLRSGFICQDCIQEFIGNKLNLEIYEQITSTLKYIASSLSNEAFTNKISEPSSLVVDDVGNITIGGKTLELDAKHRTIYLFYILYSDLAFEFKTLINYKNVFSSIYSSFKTNPDNKVISRFLGEEEIRKKKQLLENNIDVNIKTAKENLRKYRKTISDKLKLIIPESQLPYYEIRECKGVDEYKKGDFYKIGLHSSYIEISETFMRHRNFK